MRPELSAHARAQRGLVTRAQALAAGYTDREIRSLSGPRGPWLGVRRGVYADRARWDRASAHEQAQLRDLAAHLTMTVDHVMSHDSAARASGMPLVGVREPLVHATRRGFLGTRTEHGVKHHRNRAGAVATDTFGPMPVTGLERTALDLGREHGFQTGVVAADWALHQGAQPAVFERELVAMTCWPNVTRARAAYKFADALAESPAESLARILVTELGHGVPELQFPVQCGSRTFWCDLRLGRHVFEVDGEAKYIPTMVGGLADRPVHEIIRDERERERLIRGEGLGLSRIVWREFWGLARDQCIARLAAEYDATCRRLGHDLPPHLEQTAARLRGARLRPATSRRAV